MGADGWQCFMPYQPDISVVLREARHEKFRKRYEGRVSRADAIAKEKEWLNDPIIPVIYPDPGEQQRVRKAIEERIAHLETMPQPTNLDEQIAELLDISAENGTGSILDMNGVSEQPEYFKVSPLPASELNHIFGTDKPDHDMVVRFHEVVMKLRESVPMPLSTKMVIRTKSTSAASRATDPPLNPPCRRRRQPASSLS